MLPVSLEVLNFGVNYGNTNKFTGGIPSEWGALKNLKELKMKNVADSTVSRSASQLALVCLD